ncbi:MAG: OB-fold domain-containing protein, partial [Chloroflexi bacterium]|nr:OB-fold domain-containing protein [Chloroflexota bacterium]
QIELDEQPGLRLTTNLIGCEPDDARIGMRVEVTFEDRGEGVAVPQFRPTAEGGA